MKLSWSSFLLSKREKRAATRASRLTRATSASSSRASKLLKTALIVSSVEAALDERLMLAGKEPVFSQPED
jgi:hypothetical protein